MSGNVKPNNWAELNQNRLGARVTQLEEALRDIASRNTKDSWIGKRIREVMPDLMK